MSAGGSAETPAWRPGETSADGPWRAAPRLKVVVLGEGGRALAAAQDLALALERGPSGGGLAVLDAVATVPGGLAALLPRAGGPAFDALILDPDTVVTPEAVAELARVADEDPMIVAVQPRFAATPGDPVVGRPAVDYASLPDLRCVYVKGSVLAEFGGGPDGGEPSLAVRLLGLNRLGFRVAVAGRSSAVHPQGRVPVNDAAVPPAWRPALARRRRSAPELADALLDGLRPGPDGRRAVAFDLSHAGPGHSGTTGLARALVGRAAARWADLALHVVARRDCFASHFADLGTRVSRVDPADPRVFAALIRVGQPFLWGEMEAAARRAPVLVPFLLDTIGLDCQRDAPDELDALWRSVLAESDGLLFNSAFTARQFARRFAVPPDTPALTSLHSLDVADYRSDPRPPAPARPDGAVLVVGNALPHKRLRETATLLAGAGLDRRTVVLGLEPGAVAGVEARPSGGVSPAALAGLYEAAAAVVYPSVYEGFGFPVLEALAHRRPVLVRPLLPYAEIAAGLPEAANIHAFADDADLLRRLDPPPSWTEAAPGRPVRGWDDATDDLRAVLDAALARADHGRVVRRIDLLRGRMAFMRSLSVGDRDRDGEGLDRLAGMAGRLAQSCVAGLGRRLPGGRALAGAAARAWLDRR